MAQKSKDKSAPRARDLQEVIDDIAVYPPDAYDFLQLGLQFTVARIHAETPEGESHHVSGQQLSLGLRDYAWDRWGMLARSVLARWNITSTMDFGRLVYALVDAEILAKTPTDRIDDFRNVYDFKTLETGYVLPAVAAAPTPGSVRPVFPSGAASPKSEPKPSPKSTPLDPETDPETDPS